MDLSIVLYVSLLVLASLNVFQFFVIRGFLRNDRTNTGKHVPLSGKEIEEIRQKLSSLGIQTVTADDIYNLIRTIWELNLGVYQDTDPYLPFDPYDNVGEEPPVKPTKTL